MKKETKSETSQYLYSVLRQAGKEFRRYLDIAQAMLMRTPLPRVLLIFVGIILLLAVLPLLLTLFVLLMLIKIFIVVLLMNVRSARKAKERNANSIHHRP